jgi:predicted glycosyltransferase
MPTDSTNSNRKIWIDFDNSPHVPFFAPIIKELRSRGHVVVLSARDAYQVYELADRMHFEYAKIGRHYGRHKLLKILGTCLRTLQLIPFVLRHRPDLAVSHGSRGQIIVCSLVGTPALAIFDYEFASSVGTLGPKWLMVPDVISDSALSAERGTILKYPGIKEDVYAPQFRPDPSIKTELGLKEGNLVVTLRPPATEAHYHCAQSDTLYEEAVKYLSEQADTTVILLPRNGRQAAAARKAWPKLIASGKMILPEHAVDGMNLIWYSDLVISGGGTMNREAAALDVPVYSIFRGPTGSVDRYLSEHNRLVMVESVAEVRTKIKLCRREHPAERSFKSNPTLNKIVDEIIRLAGANANAADFDLAKEKVSQAK